MIACINFMNLSTAKATGRMKEVGIRKAIGAPRKSLVLQYLGESVLMSFISLMIAMVIVELFLPQFNEITGKQLTLDLTANLVISLFTIAAFTGLVAGSYPAIYLSGFNPVVVLKGRLKNSVGEKLARKGLVVFQFTLSVILIVAVLVVYKQMEYIQTKNLGYVKDNIVYFDKEGRVAANLDAFLSEVKNIPGIVNASSIGQNIIGINSSTYGLSWEGKKEGELIFFVDAGVDYDMIETLGIEMQSGRSFSRDFGADSSAIIFNEAAIDVMGLKAPIGKVVNLWGKNRQIVGVVKNFNFESLHENVKPLFFVLDPQRTMVIMARVKAGMEKETLDRFQKFYQTYNAGFSFDYKFLDKDYQALYSAENRVALLSRYFAGVAIMISCLGLFGLAAFTAERRLKEIGIRKVLGASMPEIIYLLSKELAGWVLIANLIAWPVAYYFMNGWLHGFAYRTPMNAWMYLLAGGMAMVIALATVSFQAIKAAAANPVDSLRYE
jgi:putative ABC transport system permease protein